MTSPRLLVVDDDPNLIDFVVAALGPSNLTIESAASGEEALDRVREGSPAIMLLDLVLPGIDGLETLRRLRREGFELPIVMITSYGNAETTMQAMEEGAWDYLTKPLHVADLTSLVERLLQHTDQAGIASVADLADGSPELLLLGRSPAMVEVFKAIGRVAKRDDTVLLVGESGSGKGLAARAIHRHSGRPGPLLAIDCAAVPETLLESEFFGHEESPLPGADRRRIGKFERAQQGTLLLDDVDDLPLLLQGKMLRVLEDRTIKRLGGSEAIAVDVRLIAATLVELEGRVAEGRFREDLFYRLAEVTIRIPPLRERGEDLQLLTEEFVRRLAARIGRQIESIEPEVYRRLQEHPWPGNVRELWQVLRETLVLGRGPVLTVADLPDFAGGRDLQSASMADSLEMLEQAHIAQVLQETSWNQTKAAKRLGIHRNTLRRKIREYGLVPPV